MDLFNVPFKAMGTSCQIRLAAGNQAQAEQLAAPVRLHIQQLECDYSRYLPTSILSQINANAGICPTPIDEQTRLLLHYAASAYEQSDGLFDVTSGVLRKAWNFQKSIAKNQPLASEIPSKQLIKALLSVTGWPKVGWQGEDSIFLPAGFELDFGGFVKEYAADTARAKLETSGVSCALVDLGGDIAVVGGEWPIAIKDPRETNVKIAQIALQRGGLATSGNYERCFTHEGKRYSHILNPHTGWPVVTPASISVVADSCLIAGTVSTVAMLAGEDKCLDYLDDFGLPYCCVFNDGKTVNCF